MKTLSYKLNQSETQVLFVTPQELASVSSDLMVFDANTYRLYGKLFNCPSIVLHAGEKYKNWKSIQTILNRCVDLSLARDSRLAGFGGGVVCDLAGFAASVYARGCGLHLVPTTLLAMVDASLGGKTGFDFRQYKNMVGTFYPASEVTICPQLLQTLDKKQFLCGLAEAIKHGMLTDASILSLCENQKEALLERDPKILEELIFLSIRVKGDIVAEDLTEKGKRAFLNLGHTFAHALESVTGLSAWSHGEAVAWGINKALTAGVKLGITDASYAERIRSLLQYYGYRLTASVNKEKLLSAMQHDKKIQQKKLRFVLQRKQGDTLLSELSPDILRAIL